MFNDKAEVPDVGASTQHIFDEGHRVGDLAQTLFPHGLKVDTDDFGLNLDQTKKLVLERRTLFEPGFLTDGIYSRLDILDPVGKDEWDIVEVKSSTKVKDENIHDISFQRRCCERSGLKIRNCHLVHINNQYIRHGNVEPGGLFTLEDVTDKVIDASTGIEDRIREMFKVILQPEPPSVTIGSRCSEPYDCPVKSCWGGLPEYNVFQLYRGGKKCAELYARGVQSLQAIPEDYNLNAQQRIQRTCAISRQPYFNAKAIDRFLSTLKYPLYYMDFETISLVIPLYDGTRPYQRMPFQFSLHVVAAPGQAPVHYSYLAEGDGDPRPQFLAELREHLGVAGSIVTYNGAFEKGVLTELGEAFLGFQDWVAATNVRVVDLLIPFREFSYYHPEQKGSASIKHVLPALTGRGYEGLDIAKGDDASLAFLQILSGEISADAMLKIREDLLKYCSLDTEAMILIIARLTSLALGAP
ncbi:MAG: DUF2779 domain-containing protein [Dehalococcoidales bacterium]|nr:DUF2779 domain-containing protein [Dehalococcoidales bacterium]